MSKQKKTGVAEIMNRNDEWRYAKLNDISSLKYGENLLGSDMQTDGFPVYGANGHIGFHSKANLDKETVLVSCRGEYSGTINLAPAFSYVTNNSIFIHLKTANIETKFLYYVLQLVSKARMVSGSAQPQVVINDLKGIGVKYPDKKRQKQISKILSTTDQTIEKTESLIHKYQQIKAGLMRDLFTRGVTADGKLRPPREQAPELYKETPIGWIPKEWEVIPLSQMSEIASGVTLTSKISPDQKIEVPYLRVANVQDGYLDLSEIKTVRVNQKTFDNLVLKKGDVLMNEGGDFDKLGRGTVWEGEIDNCIHQNHVFRVRVSTAQLRPYYLAYWTESDFGKKYFILSSKQSTNLASINSTQLKTYPIAIPELLEQKRIEVRINSINLKLQNLKNEKNKLKSQKSGLIYDLLTGKVQVKIDQKETAHV